MPAPEPLAAILLAAGQSQRFGSNKLAFPLTINGETKPLLLHTLANWLAVFDKVQVLLPAADQSLLLLIEDLPPEQRRKIKVVAVDHAGRGMSQSLKAGINASDNAGGWLIGLADMPWVTPVLLTKLQASMLAGANIAAPFYQGRRGQPVAFAAEYKTTLLAISGDQGARQLLQQNAAQIVAVDCIDDGILRDIDTPADLR